MSCTAYKSRTASHTPSYVSPLQTFPSFFFSPPPGDEAAKKRPYAAEGGARADPAGDERRQGRAGGAQEGAEPVTTAFRLQKAKQ